MSILFAVVECFDAAEMVSTTRSMVECFDAWMALFHFMLLRYYYAGFAIEGFDAWMPNL